MTIFPFDTFILKVANRCNIDCDYCYVFNGKDRSALRRPARMSERVVRLAAAAVGRHTSDHGIASVTISLHGGEPLLYGADRARFLMEHFTEALSPSCRVRWVIQTNGMLLDEDWLDLLDEFDVTVGVSLDGHRTANDRHRLRFSGGSSFEDALRGIELLVERRRGATVLLAVVDLQNEPEDVYDFLAGLRPRGIDFNLPHATHDDPPKRPRLPSGHDYGEWMARLFDRWTSYPNQPSIRFLDDIVALSLGVEGSVESLGLAPVRLLVVESDGELEAVDSLRSVGEDESSLGLNVMDDSLDAAAATVQIASRQLGVAGLCSTCADCDLVSICGGGHLAHRYRSGSGYLNPSVYCQDLEFLIRHIQEAVTSALEDPGIRDIALGRR